MRTNYGRVPSEGERLNYARRQECDGAGAEGRFDSLAGVEGSKSSREAWQ